MHYRYQDIAFITQKYCPTYFRPDGHVPQAKANVSNSQSYIDHHVMQN
jgi:hypothetical protein